MRSEIGGKKLFSSSEFGFCPQPRAGVVSSKWEPPTPGWRLGSGRTPGLPGPLGRAAPPHWAAEGGGAGHGVLVLPGSAQSSQPPGPRRISRFRTAKASQGTAAGRGGDWKRTGATLRRGAQTFLARAAGPPAPVVSPSQKGFFSFCHCEFAFPVRLGRTYGPNVRRCRVRCAAEC